MASAPEHFKRANENLAHLQKLNSLIPGGLDWQITTCFYVAVHLVNGHIASKANLHFQTHKETEIAIFNEMSICKIDDEIYKAYMKLTNLSRRSRYMCHEADEERAKNGNLYALSVNQKHLAKALRNLDKILLYFSKMHNIEFDKINITCSEFSISDKFNYFTLPQKQN